MTNLTQSPVFPQLSTSRPGSPKLCNKPLKTSPFESFRDPVTGRWINYLPDCKSDCRTDCTEVIETSQLSLQPSLQPSMQSAPLAIPIASTASELRQSISLFDRLLLNLKLAVSKYSVLRKFRPLGKRLIVTLRAIGIAQTLRKFFTAFWVLAR